MEIKKIFVKQAHVNLELSGEEIEMILDFMDNCVLDYGNKGEKVQKAGEYITKTFFPMLDALSKQIKEIEG